MLLLASVCESFLHVMQEKRFLLQNQPEKKNIISCAKHICAHTHICTNTYTPYMPHIHTDYTHTYTHAVFIYIYTHIHARTCTHTQMPHIHKEIMFTTMITLSLNDFTYWQTSWPHAPKILLSSCPQGWDLRHADTCQY